MPDLMSTDKMTLVYSGLLRTSLKYLQNQLGMLSPVENGGVVRVKIWVKVAEYMRAVR